MEVQILCLHQVKLDDLKVAVNTDVATHRSSSLMYSVRLDPFTVSSSREVILSGAADPSPSHILSAESASLDHSPGGKSARKLTSSRLKFITQKMWLSPFHRRNDTIRFFSSPLTSRRLLSSAASAGI